MYLYRIWASSLLFLVMTGCAAPPSPSFCHEIALQCTIHIVGTPAQFPLDARRRHPRGIGFAYPNNEIWILGTRVPDGSIHVNQELIGHEILHLLHWQDPNIQDPDIDQPTIHYTP